MIKEEQIVKQSQKKKIYWVTEFDESVNRWSRPLEYNNSIIEIEALTQEEADAKVSVNQVIDKQWGSQKYYLLGKWGSENLSFEELATKAKNRFLKEKRTEYLMMIKETQRKLDDLELETINLFGV